MRVLLADEQAEVRSALRLLLEQGFHLEVIGEVTHGSMLLLGIRQTCPDLLLLDWDLPQAALAELFSIVARRYPTLQIMVLGGRPEAERSALAAGATTFIPKGAGPDRLLRALQLFSEQPAEGQE